MSHAFFRQCVNLLMQLFSESFLSVRCVQFCIRLSVHYCTPSQCSFIKLDIFCNLKTMLRFVCGYHQ